MQKPTTVIIIDSHSLFRRGISQTISADSEFLVVGEASSGEEGLKLVKQLKPDIALTDLNVKGVNNLQTLKQIRKEMVLAYCIVLTASNKESDLKDALRVGVNGYLLKEMAPEDLCKSLRKAMSGVVVLHESLTNILINTLTYPTSKRSSEEMSLTEREREVLACLAKGFRNQIIAKVLNISETTVKVHIKHLLSKLSLTSRLEAAVWAHKRELFFH